MSELQNICNALADAECEAADGHLTQMCCTFGTEEWVRQVRRNLLLDIEVMRLIAERNILYVATTGRRWRDPKPVPKGSRPPLRVIDIPEAERLALMDAAKRAKRPTAREVRIRLKHSLEVFPDLDVRYELKTTITPRAQA